MPTDWSDTIVIAELADEPEMSEELSAIFARLNQTGASGGGGAAGSSGGTGGGAGGGAGAKRQSPHVILNFSGVRHLNSSHLAQLLRLRKKQIELGKSMVLCSLGDDLWSVMMLTGLDKVFRFATDPMTALAGLQLEEARGG
ncbi:MAG: STAS domain-containing protein [Phycisphaerales bacterium]|nr:STAS domain-containing protein [Phycisphaerales bacterium]